MNYLSEEGLKEREKFLKDVAEEYGVEKVKEWMEDDDKRQLINAACESGANL